MEDGRSTIDFFLNNSADWGEAVSTHPLLFSENCLKYSSSFCYNNKW